MLNNYGHNFSQESIDSAHLVKNDLWMIRNFFDPAVIEDILNRIVNETNWHKQELQEHSPRDMLGWEPDGLIDDIWCILDDLDFSKFGLKFKHVTVWKDSPGYTIAEHEDNDRVKGAMQIYLNDIPQNLGTWFEEIEIPFIKNTGYIMKNTIKPKHGMKTIVPDHIIRYSLYVWFELV